MTFYGIFTTVLAAILSLCINYLACVECLFVWYELCLYASKFRKEISNETYKR